MSDGCLSDISSDTEVENIMEGEIGRSLKRLSHVRRLNRKWQAAENKLYRYLKEGHADPDEKLTTGVRDLNIWNHNGVEYSNLLTVALESGNHHAFKRLISEGCDVWFIDPSGMHIFHHIAKYGGLEFMYAACEKKSYLEIYERVNLAAKDGRTPALEACNYGCLRVLKFLVAFGADVKKSK